VRSWYMEIKLLRQAETHLFTCACKLDTPHRISPSVSGGPVNKTFHVLIPANGYDILTGFYSKINQMHLLLEFILFWNKTLHVSDGFSVHHQESKTVHTATGLCQTDSADCLLAGTRRYWFLLVPASKQSAESV